METFVPIRYFDREFKVDAIKILPGQYYAAQGDVAIITVLGSCVSACLWDPQLSIGGMNHFMLPGDTAGASAPSRAAPASARLGVYAMEVLINELIHIGADRRRLVAKVFGGANVLEGFGLINIGSQNSAFVIDFLKEENIPVIAQDLLDTCARKVYFFPRTGKVLMKKLRILKNDTVAARERDYLKKLDAGVASEFEVFKPKR